MHEGPQSPGRRDPSDESLMLRYADGDTDAFTELFRRHERRAYAFFLKRTGSVHRAEDLYQELFLRIHRSRDRYDPSRPFLPWFFQIAQRLWIDEIRHAFRSRETAVDPNRIGSRAPGADRVVADREDLGAALDALTDEERYVLVSFKIGGRQYSELAAGLGKSVEAVRKVASRAMQRIGAASRSNAAQLAKS